MKPNELKYVVKALEITCAYQNLRNVSFQKNTSLKTDFIRIFRVQQVLPYQRIDQLYKLSFKTCFNPFHATYDFIYPLKITENLRFSVIFRGYIKRSVTGNAVIWFVNLCVFLAHIYLFNVNIRNTRKSCEICSKLIIKTSERRQRFKTNTIQSEYKNNLFMNYERVIDATQNIPESTK